MSGTGAIKFVPREYQTMMTNHILATPKCAVWASMGLGKTASVLSAILSLDIVDPRPVLVIAPLRVAIGTWPDEVDKWDQFSHMEVSVVCGSVPEREKAVAKKAKIYVTNYENIPWLVENLDEWPYSVVIADESTRLKSFRLRQGGMRARALCKATKNKVERFIELTGTPAPNGLVDLWGQMYFLDAGVRLGRSFTAFTSRWFVQERVGQSEYAVKLSPQPFAQEQIGSRLSDICTSLKAEDYFDIDAPIFETIHVDLPARAQSMYRKMEKEMYLALDSGSEVEAFNAASKTIKCLQIANGAIYTDETGSEWSVIHDAKIAALQSVISEAAGAPVLVAYHFKSDLARLKSAFPSGKHLDKNPQTVRDWNAGKIPIMFAHPASAGHGLNLQDGGNILAFFGHWWSLEGYQQIIERIGPTRQLQSGHPRPVYVYDIVARDTVDEVVMSRRDGKITVQAALLDAMRRRNG